MSSDAHCYASTAAVILAGGKGTRLSSVISDRPKVLASVLKRPFIFYLLDQLKEAGLTSVVLSTGYMGDIVKAELGENYDSLKLSYSVEDTPLGTGGGLRLAINLIASDLVLVLNGDSYSDLDLDAFLEWFVLKDRECAIALVSVADAGRFGSVELAPDSKITSFTEKGAGRTGPGLINAGVYLMKRSLIAEIKEGEPYSLERELFSSLTDSGRLWGFPFEGPFIDIGTPESYAVAESFFADK